MKVIDGDGEGIVAGDEEIVFGKSPEKKREPKRRIDVLADKANAIANDPSPEYGNPVVVSDLPIRKKDADDNRIATLWVALSLVFLGVVVWLAVR